MLLRRSIAHQYTTGLCKTAYRFSASHSRHSTHLGYRPFRSATAEAAIGSQAREWRETRSGDSCSETMKTKTPRSPLRHDRCELVRTPVTIEREQVFLKSQSELARRNRLDLGASGIECHMVSENRLNACRKSNVAKVRLAKFSEAPKDLGVLTAIPDALEFCCPGSAHHAVKFFLRSGLTLDEALVLAVVRE